jgi:hypothetical protein
MPTHLTEDLNRRTAAIVPLLNGDQKQTRVSVRKDLQGQSEKDRNLLCEVVTEDENWVCGYDEDSRISRRFELNCWRCLTASRNGEFRRCFQQWERNLARCIISEWDCFEGDRTDFYVR